MARNRRNYIREWRHDRGLTQKQLVERLGALSGEGDPGESALRVPTTEASLSRVETGKQNFTMATLEAIADALSVEEPGWLLDRNPAKEGKVISMVERLTPEQSVQAEAVLKAMFG